MIGVVVCCCFIIIIVFMFMMVIDEIDFVDSTDCYHYDFCVDFGHYPQGIIQILIKGNCFER